MTDREKIIDGIKNYMRENAEMGWVNEDEVLQKIKELIPEGAAILTKEDMKKYAKDCIIGEITGYDILNGLIARAERQREQARKETAMDISNDISKAIKIKEDIYGREYQIIYEDEILKLKKKLKEKFGVEMEE